MTTRFVAQALAARGFKVFPIKAGSKYPPLCRDWPNRATSQPDVSQFPTNCNIGIHCVGLIVVDVDPRSGGSGV